MKALLIAMTWLTFLGAADVARAEFGIVPGSLVADAFDESGAQETRTGVHPHHVTTRFALNTVTEAGGQFVDGTIKDVRVELPAGLAGNPMAVPQCPRARFAATPATGVPCPVESQVGLVRISMGIPGFIFPLGAPQPVYSVQPRKGVAADFAFFVASAPVHVESTVRRNGEYTVTATARNISHQLNLAEQELELWGVPWDSSNDDSRACVSVPLQVGCESLAIGGVRRPLLANPTRCGVAPVTKVSIASWQDPDTFLEHSVPGTPLTGCEQVPFEPAFSAQPDTTQPDAPSGLEVDLSFPQEGWESPTGVVTAHLRRATVTLPEGMTISPSGAHGLVGCSDAELGLDSDAEAICPAASKIGTVEAETPVLDEPLEGGIFVGTQRSGDPASGELFRIFTVLRNEQLGINVKLGGQVRANPLTGRLETTFGDNPQLPVSRIALRFHGGPRAALATPPGCGPKTVEAELESWAGHSVTLTDGFEIECQPGGGFTPDFAAGSISPVGGAFSPLAVRIERDDREGYLSGVRVDLPSGLLAKLAGVPLCGSAAASGGGCPADSRIGTATTAAGPGSSPYWLTGPVYLTEGYRGAPYGLAVHVHAKAGPYDLGWVRVRQALHVDRETAEVSVVSDPLPQIVKGVPIRLRSVNVDVDRPGFTVNPTSCSEKRIDATLTSIDGAVHRTSSRFQVGDCRALGFRPRLGMRLVGKGRMRSGGHPALRAVVTQGDGQANIRAAKVRLPRDIVLDSENAYDPALVCPYDPAQAGDCPASSVIGRASLSTPLLNRPLSGPVHLVQGIRFGPTGNRIRSLPTLLVKLRGEVAINLRSRTSVDGRNRLVSTFPAVPDARAGRFTIQIDGGRKGILVVTENRRGRIDLCRSRQTALVETDGHNGKRADFPVRVKTPCGSRASAKKRNRAR